MPVSAVRSARRRRARSGDPGRRRLRRRAPLRRVARRARAARRVGRRRRRSRASSHAARRPTPPSSSAPARPTSSRSWSQLHQAEAVIFDQALSPAQQRNLERHLGVAGRRPHDADPRDLRRARAEPRRQAAGRAGAAAVPVDPAGPALEPPRAPARRHRHARRPGRSADRARPPHDRRAHQEHQEAAREGEAPAQHAAARARAQRGASASRWSATPTPASRRCSTRWSTPRRMPPTSCSRRSTRRRASCTCDGVGALGRAVRHGRLHPRPAARR